MTKRNMYQIGLVVVLILIAALLFRIGKGHTLLIDNNAMTINGKAYAAVEAVRVTVDGQPKPITVKSGERDQTIVKGASHSVKAELLDANGTVTATVEKKFKLATLADAFILSTPAILADDPGAIQEFQPTN